MAKGLLEQLGFKRTLNAGGHITVYGGSCPDPRVVRAMDEASGRWVDMRALERNTGKLLATQLGCEDGFVTSGAYAANAMAAQAALSLARERGRGTKSPNVVIQSCHITKYAESYVAGGLGLKEVKRRSESESLAEHIDPSTVAVAYVLNDQDFEFNLRETVDACGRAGIPAIVDAAVVDPAIRGIKEVLAYGPDSVSVSGGKSFNGPNATGLLVGRAAFVSRARDLSFPNYGPGRGMKVSKEQVVGLMKAVELAAASDDEKLVDEWRERAERVKASLQGIPNLRTEVVFPWRLNFPQPVPRVGIYFETADGEKRAEEAKRRLAEGSPQVLVRPSNDVIKAKNSITLDLRTLRKNEVRVLAESLRAVISAVMRQG
ncbi:MAG: hypothetical protein JRN13_06265 [Nitrososphaerota archaeon]|jgi:L-seryl-tRNA(Ser) seleniumtransferase|nr:hypothetical protein [Nitrososphaerota archaeon]MDG6959849.1 hypothetical protein [Nitrososphaerota archaeon]MDG6961936.1 hypothetical protein [Nitrososphaerota archaeon]MDG6965831.1 hypothetical protein [Nitrososphaerota archaeon]MDG6972920.1 hypothetical protein [Nitrososphaerota archaeon]